METHADFLATIDDHAHRDKLTEMLDWVSASWPDLEPVVKWKQPMYTHHGTFIVAFGVFAKNIALNPEPPAMEHFRDAMHAAGYTTSPRLMRIAWDDPIDRDLIAEIIDWQIEGKADVTGFWRP